MFNNKKLSAKVEDYTLSQAVVKGIKQVAARQLITYSVLFIGLKVVESCIDRKNANTFLDEPKNPSV